MALSISSTKRNNLCEAYAFYLGIRKAGDAATRDQPLSVRPFRVLENPRSVAHRSENSILRDEKFRSCADFLRFAIDPKAGHAHLGKKLPRAGGIHGGVDHIFVLAGSISMLPMLEARGLPWLLVSAGAGVGSDIWQEVSASKAAARESGRRKRIWGFHGKRIVLDQARDCGQNTEIGFPKNSYRVFTPKIRHLITPMRHRFYWTGDL